MGAMFEWCQVQVGLDNFAGSVKLFVSRLSPLGAIVTMVTMVTMEEVPGDRRGNAGRTVVTMVYCGSKSTESITDPVKFEAQPNIFIKFIPDIGMTKNELIIIIII